MFTLFEIRATLICNYPYLIKEPSVILFPAVIDMKLQGHLHVPQLFRDVIYLSFSFHFIMHRAYVIIYSINTYMHTFSYIITYCILNDWTICIHI